ncbi:MULTISPECIES: helix-turn-helix domain-containing protein [Nitrosomonas]|uniref:Uncharacterized protein n=1 Tax=Nitrosomonas communis TaxID=44574 RepID=A0A0F7KDQ1_9PROT|nr:MULTISPECIES: helix-turn-helix transcriptional regulator [Nitrosomonas]AKH36874.1 hypothetical protein AAW31_02160 [Nitrosomonas communis]TYP83907.1 hypothetical protein BCL69_104033 [Nitrosomonas communis]UVS61978.1 LacI family transcriptional regulator [Nitrosomonas sp. PLL12]
MWRDLLNAAVAASSKTQVAAHLGVSRTAVSLVVHGKYPADTRHIASRVLEVYGRIPCPHLGKEINQAECRSYHSSQPPTSSPRAMKHWRACQSCKYNEATRHNLRSNP